ncbi:MAG: 3-oxoacyl-ACP reductase FabG [Armatimonadetes bacterium]|nr:3-oxoacyl-ACP reductase FabG [Armatimonadota bacterium]
MRLAGKAALVTGGGTGIGRAISLAFAREGADVAVNYSRSEAQAQETAEEIRGMGRRATLVRADVSNSTQVDMMITEVADRFGRLDILVNNAGITVFVDLANLEAITEGDWDRIFNVNVKGLFLCTRAASRIMQDGGVVINISSVAAFGRGSSIPYCASKAAVNTLTRSLAIALAPRIRVVGIAPGFIDTRWTAQWGPQQKERSAAATPLKRVGQPEDIARLAVYLAADGDFVTGRTFVVDGGRTL